MTRGFLARIDLHRAAVSALTALLLGCGPRERPNSEPDTGAGDVADVRADVTDVRADVAPVDPCAPAPCGPRELCGQGHDGGAGSGNGLDDDCDGEVDEDCTCYPGEAHACFPGPSDRRGIGPCHDGTALCGELESWGTCSGAVVPAIEICDGIDNDCDGRADEDLDGCASALRCPANAAARPLTEYVADAREFDPAARTFAWTVECPVGVSPCPAPSAPRDPVLRYRVVQSGTYVVRVEFTHADDSRARCRYPLYVQGSGLRVELDWDTKGGRGAPGVDMDLHLAPIDPRRASAARWFSPDDCYYATCTAPGGRVEWNVSAGDMRFVPNSDVSVCAGAPPPNGDVWRASGRCWNPRLDVDDITCDPSVTDVTNPAFCFVENINVDQPPEDVTFRVMVNFYQDHGTCTDDLAGNDVTRPWLRIYCGGILRGEVGGVDDGEVPMPCAQNQGIGSANWSWLAADVRFATNACGLQDCQVRALRSAASRFVPCGMVSDADDTCQDGAGRVFVRRAGARPVDADLPAALY